MSNIKEQIIGAVTIMNEEDAAKVWDMIKKAFAEKEWEAIPEEQPDEIDFAMLDDIKSNPDCHEFLSSDETMKLLNL